MYLLDRKPLNIRVFEFRVFVFFTYDDWNNRREFARVAPKSEIYVVVTCYVNAALTTCIIIYGSFDRGRNGRGPSAGGEIFYGSYGYRCVNNPIFVCCQNSKPSLVSCGYRQTSSLASLFDRLITVPPENLGWVFVNLAIGNPIRVYRIPRFKLFSESDILWLCHPIILYGFNNTFGTSAFIERNV